MMVSFDLKKKWINDCIKPKMISAYKIPDKDLIGDWEYIDENTVYKFIETIIMNYRRRLLVTARFHDYDDGTSRLMVVDAREVEPN